MRNACEIACHNYGAWCAQTPTVLLPWRAPFRSSSREGINPAIGHFSLSYPSIGRSEMSSGGLCNTGKHVAV